jgi:hypothetical protein
MSTYFGFGLADNMFPIACTLTRRELTPEEVRSIVADGIEPCLNPSHAETIRVMRERFGIHVAIPTKAPIAALQPGDRLIVMAVTGLPRLEGRHEYTETEIRGAKFRFGLWTLSSGPVAG